MDAENRELEVDPNVTPVEDTFDPNAFMKSANPDTVINETTEDVINEASNEAQDKTDTNASTQQNNDFNSPFKSAWEILVEDLSTEDKKFEIPDFIKTRKKEDGTELTAKEEFAKLRDYIFENTDFGFDETMQEYMSLKQDPNFNKDQWLQQKAKMSDVGNWKDDDYLSMGLKTQYDLNDEEVREYIDNMKPVEKKIKTKEFKDGFEGMQREQQTKEYNNYRTNFIAETEKNNTENKQVIDNLLKSIEGKNSIAGFELSKADMDNLKTEFPEFLKQSVVEDNSGIKGRASKADKILNEIMSDPQKAFDLSTFLWLYDKGKIQSYTTQVKENAKQSIASKLNPTPDFGASGSGSTQEAFSWDAFKRSAGL